MPCLHRVLIEATVVAAAFVAILKLVLALRSRHAGRIETRDVALAAALFHVVCEYTGVNAWYVTEYDEGCSCGRP